MLVLVTGATGNIGREVVQSALRRGHRVRAMGRSSLKIPEQLHSQLEDFVESEGMNDTAALDAACKGVDAVICAYGPGPELALDGQLALLRAAERAGVTRYHAASWNLDWSHMPLGVQESYDPYISFARQAKLTSSIKPLYVFCGVLAMTLFGVPGAGALEGDSSMWIRKQNGERAMNVVGDGKTRTQYGLESDVADFSVALTTSDVAEKGGYYCFCSDEFTMVELKETYENVKGAKCEINHVMDVETCKSLIKKMRAEAEANGDLNIRREEIVGLVYAQLFDEGTWNPEPVDSERFPDVKRTSIKELMQTKDWI